MSTYSIAQAATQVKFEPLQQNRAETLALADEVLGKYNAAWGQYVATGDAGAFKLALALWQDRLDLLGEI